MSTLQVFYHENTHILQISGLKDSISGEYISNATVTFTVSDDSGNPIAGAVDLPATYVSGSQGVYRGTIPPTLVTSGFRRGKIKVSIDGGAAGTAVFLEQIDFQTRRFEDTV